MKQVSDIKQSEVKKTMLKGGFAAAGPGIIALVAAFTVPVPLLIEYTAMGSMGVAALGVIFFYAAYLLYRGYWWASIPSLSVAAMGLWFFGSKALRLLTLYYEHNPIITLTDLIAPFSIISLQLVLVFVSCTLGLVIFKTARFCMGVSPHPVKKYVWGAAGMWGVVIVLDCMNKFQY